MDLVILLNDFAAIARASHFYALDKWGLLVLRKILVNKYSQRGEKLFLSFGATMRALKGVVCVCFVLPMTLSLLCFGCPSHRESVALEMSWKRGDEHYGPNFIHLESACLSNPEPGRFCALDFKATNSKEFADYIGSFGTKKVPVKFHVDYDHDHHVFGALLERVGEWPENRFQINEKSLATGFRMNNPSGGGHLNNPADCFPKAAK